MTEQRRPTTDLPERRPAMDLPTAFAQTVRRTPDRTAVVVPGDDRYSYEALDRRTDAAAAALEDLAGSGRVAALLGNGLPALTVLLGALKRGRAVVPLNVRESPETLASMVENGGADLLVFGGDTAERAADLLEHVDVAMALCVGDPGPAAEVPVADFERSIDRADPGDFDRRGDEFGVFHTSGSTGPPKAVLVDSERLWYASTQTVMEMGLEPDDVALVYTPLFHIVTSESWVFPHFLVGGTLVLPGHTTPGEALALVDEHDVTGLLGVPPQLDELAAAAADGEFHLDTLASVRTGGGPLHPGTVERVRDHLCPAVHNTYGLTEGVSNVTHASPADQVDAPGTVGRASFNWEVRVVRAVGPDETPDPDAVVRPGETGEVLARGPIAVDGYLDDSEATSDLFVEDPSRESGDRPTPSRWVRTGDIAEVDGTNRLHIVDRVDNMIVTGGENVYPQEVETVLLDHPDVVEAAVVGVPHEKWGTAVVAVVVGDVGAGPLDRHCRNDDSLADFKRPKECRVVDEALPRTPVGNVRRDAVKEKYFEE